jgi:hypothetical protein
MSTMRSKTTATLTRKVKVHDGGHYTCTLRKGTRVHWYSVSDNVVEIEALSGKWKGTRTRCYSDAVYQAIEREPATPTLIDRIEAAMTSDEDRDEKQSEYLQTRYERADEQTKQAIDFCFVALCGWSLGTLIKGEEGK